MFLGCIEFISKVNKNTFVNISIFTFEIIQLITFKVKTGPFAEHSNQLWNVSAVGSWSKVNSGLIRMYKAEVNTFIFFYNPINLYIDCLH